MTLSALVPAYKPDQNLVDVVRSLNASQLFQNIVVIDDGGGDAFAAIFATVAKEPNVIVLHHAVNLGKGAALKTGMNYILVHFPENSCVTADADGQHAPTDIARVAERLRTNPNALVLGARKFDGKVPLRSRFGNVLTRYVFKFVVGRALIDTQTGLRGVPASLMRRLLTLQSNRYEFEMDMLVVAAQAQTPILEEVIQTIYVADNATSHFNPFFDSFRIYFVLLRYALSSATAYLIDLTAFAIAFSMTQSVLTAQITARAFSVPVNFWLVRDFVFDSRGRMTVQFALYLLVVIVSGVISYFSQIMLSQNFGLPVIAAKLTAESILFFANFLVLRDWVFAKREKPLE